MKTGLLVFLLLCGTMAFSQATAPTLPNESAPMRLFGHPEHASRVDMATPQVVLQDSSFYHEKGNRPLWEFPAINRGEVSLGEIARRFRREQQGQKKSETVWIN